MKNFYFLLLSTCVMAPPVYAENLPPVLDNSVYTNSFPPSPAEDYSSPTSYDNSSDLQELKNDLSSLKNKIQEQESTIGDLKRSNEELQKKLTESAKKAAVPAVKFPQKPHTLPNVPLLEETSIISPTPDINSEKERYQKAIALLKKSDYNLAIAEFQSLIKAYPKGQYADNAQYWIGVALMNKNDKKGAMLAFDRLARTYPNSDKVPEGLYKLGSILVSVKNTAKAKEYFDYVIEKYPGTESAKLAAKAKAKL